MTLHRIFLPNIVKLDFGYQFSFPYPERMDLVSLARSLPFAKFDYPSKSWYFQNWPEASHPLFSVIQSEKFLLDPQILPNHFGLWEDLEREIRNRNYTARTFRSYLFWNQDFLKFTSCLPRFVEEKDFLDYQNFVILRRQIQGRTIAALQSALVFYYRTVRHQFLNIPFPRVKKEKHLPEILSFPEIKAILSSPSSPKHKLILALAYSAGLRVSEVVRILLSDIDMERGCILIKQSKGRKDRIAILSDKLKGDILHYLHNRKVDSKWLFFTAIDPNKHISIRTAEKIFENAKKECKIQKKVSFHSLRHAFATHLLEKGIDIRVIQTLLGHESVRTTQIYAQVTQTKLLNVISPYDDF